MLKPMHASESHTTPPCPMDIEHDAIFAFMSETVVA